MTHARWLNLGVKRTYASPTYCGRGAADSTEAPLVPAVTDRTRNRAGPSAENLLFPAQRRCTIQAESVAILALGHVCVRAASRRGNECIHYSTALRTGTDWRVASTVIQV